MADPLPEPHRCLSCGDALPPLPPIAVGHPTAGICGVCLRRMGKGLLEAQASADVEAAVSPVVEEDWSRG